MTHYPEPQNFTGIESIFHYMNTIGQGWTIVLFVLVMHIVLLAFMKQKGNSLLESALSSSYVMMIAVGLFYAMGVIPVGFAVFYGILLGVLMVGYLATKN